MINQVFKKEDGKILRLLEIKGRDIKYCDTYIESWEMGFLWYFEPKEGFMFNEAKDGTKLGELYSIISDPRNDNYIQDSPAIRIFLGVK